MKRAALPPRYLHKKTGRYRGIRVYDLAVLMVNMVKAMKDPEIGWADVLEGWEQTKKRLNFLYFLAPDQLEGLLWAANMLDEKQEFWHPDGKTFDQFLGGVIKRGTFNKTFNHFEEEKKDERTTRDETSSSASGTSDPDNPEHGGRDSKSSGA